MRIGYLPIIAMAILTAALCIRIWVQYLHNPNAIFPIFH
jgi:hypothetical protein